MAGEAFTHGGVSPDKAIDAFSDGPRAKKRWTMKISEIQDALKAEILVGEEHLDEEISGGGGADLMEDILAAVARGAVLLTGLTTDDVIRTAKVAGVACLVFVRGKQPEESALELARSFDLPILLTEDSMFVACGRLYMNGLRGLDGSW